MKKKTLLLLSLFLSAGIISAVGLKEMFVKNESSVMNTEIPSKTVSVQPRVEAEGYYTNPAVAPGPVLCGNLKAYKDLVIDAIKADQATDGTHKDFDPNSDNISMGSSKNGSWLVVPVKAETTGIYTVTISASTNRGNNVASLNVVALEESVDYNTYIVNDANKMFISGTSWSSMNDYSWNVNLTGGVTHNIRVSMETSNRDGWCANLSKISIKAFSYYTSLQDDIAAVNTLLADADYYIKLTTDEDLVAAYAALYGVIEQVQNIQQGTDEADIIAGRELLAAAVASYKEVLSKPFIAPVVIDLPLFTKSYNLKVTKIEGANPEDNYIYNISETHNGSFLIYKIDAEKAGSFHAKVSVALNDAGGGINFAVGTDLDAVEKAQPNADNTRPIDPNGWGNYSDYELPAFDMLAGQTYYIKLTFTTTVNWAPGMNRLEIIQDEVYSVWKELQADIVEVEKYFKKFTIEGTVEYSKAIQKDKDALASAIATAKTVTEVTADEDCSLAREALKQALTTFKSQVAEISMVPGAIDFLKYETKSGSVAPDADGILGSTTKGNYIVYKFRTRSSGLYGITFDASTNEDGNPQVNVMVSDNYDALVNGTPDNADFISIEKILSEGGGNGWNNFKTYNVPKDASLLEGKDYYVRISYTLASGNWVANLKSVKFNLKQQYTPYDVLQVHIANAEGILSMYSTEQSPYYTKVAAADRTALSNAIKAAKSITDNAAGEVIAQAQSTLLSAVDGFLAKVSVVSVVPGYIDFADPVKVIDAKKSMLRKLMSIESTQQGAAVIYKIRANKTGKYIPSFEAATNTFNTVEKPGNPRIDMIISQNFEEISVDEIAENAPVVIERGLTANENDPAWNLYAPYEFSEVSLQAGEEYYVRLSFYSALTWCANIKNMNFVYADVDGVNSSVSENIAMRVYPNPAKDFVTINITDESTGEISIFNSTGSLCKMVVVNGTQSIDISDLAAGLYFVTKQSKNGIQVVKLIVNK